MNCAPGGTNVENHRPPAEFSIVCTRWAGVRYTRAVSAYSGSSPIATAMLLAVAARWSWSARAARSGSRARQA